MGRDPKTTEPLTVEERAVGLHNAVSERRGLPMWNDVGDDIRASWIKCVEDCDEIGRGVSYED